MKHEIEAAGKKAIAIRELQNLNRKVISGPLYDAIEGITLSGTDPVAVTLTGHAFETGDKVAVVGDIVGTVELEGWTGFVTDTDANTVTLQGTDSSEYTAYTSGGALVKLVEVPDLQEGDFLFSVIGFDGDGATLAEQVVDFTDNASVVAEELQIEGITLVDGDPVKITITAHGLVTGDYVYADGVGGTTELNGEGYIVTKVDADNFTLDGTNAGNFTAYTSGGTVTTQQGRIYFDEDTAAYRLVLDFYKDPNY